MNQRSRAFPLPHPLPLLVLGFWRKRKRTSTRSTATLACGLLGLLLISGEAAETNNLGNLYIKVTPRFGATPLTFDTCTNRTSAGQIISVTRLDFLLSDFALRRAEGGWFSLTNRFGYFDSSQGREGLALQDLPGGSYDRLRFHIGLSPEVNHSDAAQYPAGHALNPQVNGLHWGWLGGYVFLALEGTWSNVATTGAEAPLISGYSYHLATDRLLMTVDLPVHINLSQELRVDLALDLARVFDGLTLTDDSNSTHSRTNDPLAEQLARRIENSFLVTKIEPVETPASPAGSVDSASLVGVPATRRNRPLRLDALPISATPYRFTFSGLFPRPALPLDNPLSEEGVALGRRLFSEPLLSVNNSQSCATCHQASAGFAEHKSLSTGAEGRPGSRNAMALVNLAWKSSFFWDGRAETLREQVMQPIQNPIEMHENLTNVVRKLGENYTPSFEKAFGTPEITADRIARALEQFLLVQTAWNSKFDRVLAGEERFTVQEQHGFELFNTEYDPRREQFGADCFHCHGGPLVQSQAFANNGLDAEFKDLGRFSVTHRDGDRGKFAVPSLRNVELTAPYMHDGRFATLEEVVEHYCTGIKRSATLDPNLAKHPAAGLPLSNEDKQALVAFLKTLTDTPALERLADRRPDGQVARVAR